MSRDAGPGYLTRLVARMTDEPPLRPRVRSRFEIGELRELEALAEPRLEAHPARRQPRADRAVAASDHPRSDPAQAPAPAPLPHPAPSPHQDLAGIVRWLTEGNPAGAIGRDVAGSDAAGSGVAQLDASGSGVAQPAAMPHDVQASPDRAHAISPAALSPRTAVAPDPDAPPLRAAQRPVTAADDDEARPTRHAIRVAAQPDATENLARVERREPDVVHVHIGRVEVRSVGAAPASAPVAHPPVGPRPLSLDDYLAGERRS